MIIRKRPSGRAPVKYSTSLAVLAQKNTENNEQCRIKKYTTFVNFVENRLSSSETALVLQLLAHQSPFSEALTRPLLDIYLFCVSG